MHLVWTLLRECLKQKTCIVHNVFLCCDSPNILGFFLLFVGQDQLGENYLIYSHVWGPRILYVKTMHHIFGIFRPLQINHVCEIFRLLGIVDKQTNTKLKMALLGLNICKIFSGDFRRLACFSRRFRDRFIQSPAKRRKPGAELALQQSFTRTLGSAESWPLSKKANVLATAIF